MKDYKLLIILLLTLSNYIQAQSLQTNVTNLRCEYLVNPLGVDSPNPRLSWMMTDSRLGANQKAYQLLVSTDSLEIIKTQGTTWNSGKILSNNMLVRFDGEKLKPFTKYFWSVLIGIKTMKK